MGINEFGGPEKLQSLIVENPEIENDSGMLVRVKAAGVGIWDAMIREGTLPTERGFPLILGMEISGVVEKVGGKVDGYHPGDDVFTYFWGQQGGWAEYVSVQSSWVAAKPREINYARAAGLPVAGITAHQALIEELNLRPGETIVIAGAAGGVGTIAVQLAKIIGATVIGTGSERNEDYVRKLGADHYLDYTKGDLVAQLRAVVPDGADTALDCVGGEHVEETLKLVKSGGRVAELSGHNPAARDPNTALFHVYAKPSGARLEVLAKLVADGKLRVEVERTFPLDQAKAALERVESRHVRGKVILTL